MRAACRSGVLLPSFVAAIVLASAAVAAAQPPSDKPVVSKAATGTYVVFPNVPPCMTGKVEHGDPATGPSVLLVRANAGCTVPWHWHTPNEHVMIVSGTLQLQMKGDAAPAVLRPGDYALAPAHHVHQARSTGASSFFLHSDGPFDLHYVDASGNEVPAEQVLKAKATGKPPAPAKKP